MVDVAGLVRAHGREVRLSVLAVLLAVVLLCVMAWRPGTSGALDVGSRQPYARGGIDVTAAAFDISGSAAGAISPGVTVALDLRITNPRDVSVDITDLEVTLDRVVAPRTSSSLPCSPADFQLDQAAGDLDVTVPAGSTRSLSTLKLARRSWPHVRMRDRPVNQDGCKGASLVLGYTGSGALSN
jgi:hypothetical protein